VVIARPGIGQAIRDTGLVTRVIAPVLQGTVRQAIPGTGVLRFRRFQWIVPIGRVTPVVIAQVIRAATGQEIQVVIDPEMEALPLHRQTPGIDRVIDPDPADHPFCR